MLKQAKALTLSLLMVLSAFLLVACGKPTISDASITMQTTHYVYTGVAITPDLVITWQNKVLVEQTDYVLTYHNNTNAGIASILVEGKNKFQGNKTMYFTIAPATITGISAESLNLAFEEGKHHQIEVIGLQPNDVVLYRTSTIADWTTENPQFSSFGNFVVYYQVQRANHAPFYGSATVAITPLDLTSVTAANQKVVFDGQEKSIALQGLLPTDTVRYKTSALDEWSEQNPTFQNVGNYTIYYQVQRSGFLTLESSATIIIEPKEQTIMVDDVTSVFDFQSKQIVVPADDAQIFYKLNEEDDWTQINPTFIDVGDYTVYYKVQKNNHIDLIGSAHIIITPASISVPNFSRSVTHDGSAQSLILPQLPEGAEIVFKTLVDGEWQTTLPTFTEIGEHKVYYLVTKTNHFPYSDIATLTITSRTQENVVANDVLVTYDGNDYSIHVTGAPEGSTITYSLQENGVYTQENFMVTNAGIVQVYFKIEHPFYATFMGSATVVIEKATLTLVTPPTASDITVGQPLTASTLTDGLVVHNEQEVSGIFAWKDENANNIFPTLTESGFYETLVIFEHENAQNFFPLILPMRVRVNKIAIEVHAFVRDPIAAGMSLYDIALDYDVFVQNEMIALDGTISFLPNQALIAGTNLYDWMFIPNDPNYSEYSGLISLTFPDNLTLLGVEIDAAQPTQTFYAFDLLSPSNLTVNGVYYDASTQSEIRMPVHGWTADYGEYDFLTPLHTSIAIRYASFETTFDLTVNKKFYSPYYHYLEYIGPQT